MINSKAIAWYQWQAIAFYLLENFNFIQMIGVTTLNSNNHLNESHDERIRQVILLYVFVKIIRRQRKEADEVSSPFECQTKRGTGLGLILSHWKAITKWVLKLIRVHSQS